MDKKELKKELQDIKAKIRANSVDAHFADTLVAELLSIKGQLDHEPTLVHLPLGDIDDRLEGDTFNLYTLKTGEVVYRLKGGLTLIINDRFAAAHSTLRSFVENQHHTNELSEEEQELYSRDMWASLMLLNIPTVAFLDLEFKYDMVNKYCDWLEKLQNKYLDNVELQDETPEANKAYEDAEKALDLLKTELKNEGKE